MGLPPSKVKVLERYRTKHGSHNTAFAKTVMDESKKLLVPHAEVGEYLQQTKEQQVHPYALLPLPRSPWQWLSCTNERTSSRARSCPYESPPLRNFGSRGCPPCMTLLPPFLTAILYAVSQATIQIAVRREALEDIWLLSNGAALAGTVSSHFSVIARLWAVGRGSPSVPPLWLDSRDVAKGEPPPLSDLVIKPPPPTTSREAAAAALHPDGTLPTGLSTCERTA